MFLKINFTERQETETAEEHTAATPFIVFGFNFIHNAGIFKIVYKKSSLGMKSRIMCLNDDK
jgi:hypothetical protein